MITNNFEPKCEFLVKSHKSQHLKGHFMIQIIFLPISFDYFIHERSMHSKFKISHKPDIPFQSYE